MGAVDRRPWTAAVLPAAILVVLVTALGLDLAAPADGPGATLGGSGWGSLYVALGLVYASCAAVVLLRDTRQGFGWGVAWLGAFWALDGLAQSWVTFAVRDDEVLAGANLALWFLNRVGAYLPVSVVFLLLVFPTGRLLPGRLRLAGRVTIGAMLAGATVVLVAPSGERAPDVDLPPGVDLDLWTLPLPVADDVAAPAVLLTGVLGLVTALATVITRYRRSAGVERDRMRWLVWAVVVMAVLIGLGSLLTVGTLRDALFLVTFALPVVAMTVGVVRPGALPIEDLLNRTLVGAIVAAGLLVLDLVVVTVLAGVLDERLDRRQVVTLVVVLTVVLYGPLRQRLSAGLRRFTLGSSADPYDVVAGLASTLERADGVDEQLAEVTRAVATAFGIAWVSVEVERGGGEVLAASYGERPDRTRDLPITYRGTTVGRLVLPARGLRSRLSRRDERLLGDLVRQVAQAARSGRLAEELQESRERLVVAREEERRRIRRDLHDGLGPSLSGLVFQLESARLLMEQDPPAASAVLETTSGQLREVVADIRRLVHDLRPPALDDRGLEGALAQQAERLAVPTTVTATGIGELPAAVEVAAYRIAGEAMSNVERHARAGSCEVSLLRQDGRLLVEVRDDGVGVPADVEVGVGLLSLRERAAELGGRFEITCPPTGGTVVRAWLPVEERTR